MGSGAFMRRPRILKAKEHQAVPAGAGNVARNSRQRFIGAALILEVLLPHRHAMLDALPLADQARAGNRPLPASCVAWAALPSSSSANGIQAFDGLLAQPAVGQFLNAVGEPVFQEAAVIGRGLPIEKSRHRCLRSATWAVFRADNCASTVSVILPSIASWASNDRS